MGCVCVYFGCTSVKKPWRSTPAIYLDIVIHAVLCFVCWVATRFSDTTQMTVEKAAVWLMIAVVLPFVFAIVASIFLVHQILRPQEQLPSKKCVDGLQRSAVA